uniref:Transmembrane protein 88 b n=1 Tax=Esox lucius TaxID=8010 RepID=A0AAY5KMS2_ESOLU
MSLPRTGTLEKGVTQPNHMNNEEPPSPLPSHLQHSGSVTSVPGSPTGTSVVVVPPPYSVTGSVAGGTDAPLELRGSLDCWACSVLVTAQNLIIALVNGVLASIVFSTILTPALVMVVFGFLCHSTVRRSSGRKPVTQRDRDGDEGGTDTQEQCSPTVHPCIVQTCWMTVAVWPCWWWASSWSPPSWSWLWLPTAAWPVTFSWASASFPTAELSTRTCPPRTTAEGSAVASLGPRNGRGKAVSGCERSRCRP